MNAGKDGAASVTIISAVVVALNTLLNAFGVGLDNVDGLVSALVTVIAAGAAIYGRVRARAPITSIAGIDLPPK